MMSNYLIMLIQGLTGFCAIPTLMTFAKILKEYVKNKEDVKNRKHKRNKESIQDLKNKIHETNKEIEELKALEIQLKLCLNKLHSTIQEYDEEEDIQKKKAENEKTLIVIENLIRRYESLSAINAVKKLDESDKVD